MSAEEDKSSLTGTAASAVADSQPESETKAAATLGADSTATDGKQTYVDMASNAATSASAAATGVKDSVFSMFGGGGAKEKRVETEDDAAKDEPSGSAKAAKDKEDEEVRSHCC